MDYKLFNVYAAIFGDELKKLLVSAKAAGLFEGLPKTPRYELGVSELEGRYGWPAYEDRGRENLAQYNPPLERTGPAV